MNSLVSQRHIETAPLSQTGFKFTSYEVNTAYLATNEPGKPPEDTLPQTHVLGTNLIFAVADGVTRSKNEHGVFPNPSPARTAADRALDAAVHTLLSAMSQDGPSKNLLHHSFDMANEAVRQVNIGLDLTPNTVNFLDNDYATTALTIGIITRKGDENTLYWGHIADSCLLVSASSIPVRRITSVQTAAKDELQAERKTDPYFNREEWRYYYRREVRNHKEAKALVNGLMRYIGFGALTGEENALDFVETGVLRLPRGANVLLTTDGAVMIGYSRTEEIINQSIPNKALPIIFEENRQKCLLEGKATDDMSGVSIIDTNRS